MTHLYIELNTSGIEEVNSSIISKLYELAISGDLDNTSDLKGRLHSVSGYEILVDYLNLNFSDLYISCDNKYILFYDEALILPFALLWGDGTGVTPAQLLAAGNINTKTFESILNGLLDGLLIDMRDFKRLNYNTGTGRFTNTKVSNVVHAYIPSMYNDIHTGATNSSFSNKLLDIEVSSNMIVFGTYAFYGCSNLIMDTIPDSITTLGNSCFRGCSKITINSSNNVTMISNNAFYGCTSITRFTIKNICKIEGSSIFNGCANLEEVIFESGEGPDIVFSSEGSWNAGAFYNTKITTLDLPTRIKSFGNASMNCSTLRTLIIRKETVPLKGIWSLNSNVLIYVPDTSVSLYQSEWSDLSSRIHPISELPTT